MELRQLRYFVAVAQHAHFGRAAAELHMAQPALSRAIRQFESELGVELFTRSTRHVALTAAGTVLLDDAEDLLARAERLRTRVRQAQSGHLGKVRIGCTGSASYGYLTRLMRDLTAELPGLEFELETEMLTPDQEKALLDGRLDLGILRLPVSTDELAWRVVRREPLIAALPAAHPLATREDLTVADLAREPFITYNTASGSVVGSAVLAACQDAGFTPRRVRDVTETATLLALVAAGLGVSLVPEGARAMQLEGLVFRELPDVPHVDLALAWRRDRRPAPIGPLLDAVEKAATPASAASPASVTTAATPSAASPSPAAGPTRAAARPAAEHQEP